jgi:hypothetical protein
MQMPRWWQPAAVVVACFIGSCLVGALTHGPAIFIPRLTYFQFVASGAIVGALAAAPLLGGQRAVGSVAVLSLMVMLASDRPLTASLILRDVVYVVTLVVAVWLSPRASEALARPRWGRLVVWGAVFGVCHLASFSLLTLANFAPFNWRLAATATEVGALVGVGAGLGIELLGRTRLGREHATS